MKAGTQKLKRGAFAAACAWIWGLRIRLACGWGHSWRYVNLAHGNTLRVCSRCGRRQGWHSGVWN